MLPLKWNDISSVDSEWQAFVNKNEKASGIRVTVSERKYITVFS